MCRSGASRLPSVPSKLAATGWPETQAIVAPHPLRTRLIAASRCPGLIQA